MRDGRPELIGKFGDKSRRWKGKEAGYAAKHMWLTKHYQKPLACEQCGTKEFTRLEWANISGNYERERNDYKALCPHCHRLMDIKGMCRKGHTYLKETTYVNSRGHRRCITCWNERKILNAATN